MNRTQSLAAALSCAALVAGCSGAGKLDWGAWGRAMWQRPDDVIAHLTLAPGARVADIGAGEGYFVPYLAEAVGETGRVYAVDVEADIVEGLAEEFGERGNVTAVLGEYEDPLLPDGEIDVVLLVNTYHHIQDRIAYFERLQTDLAPGGRLAIVEPNKALAGFFALFVEPEHRSHPDEVEGELAQAGYRQIATYDFLPIQVFHVYEVAGGE